MNAATQGTKTMLEAIDLEAETARLKAQAITGAIPAGPVDDDTEFVFVAGQAFVNAAKHEEVVGRIAAERDRHKAALDRIADVIHGYLDTAEPGREANSKRDPTIAKDLDREDIEPGLAPPSVAGEDR